MKCTSCKKATAPAVLARHGGVCPTCRRSAEACALDPHTATANAPTLIDDPLQELLRPGADFCGMAVKEELGRGGMSVIYKATHSTLHQTVALKVMAPKFAQDDEFVQRFIREARTMASLRHRHIVTVHDFGKHDNLLFIVMEYVPGFSLRDILKERPLPLDEVFRYLVPVMNAVEYAHDKGVIHRDIKPENILIDRQGIARLTDFGIAKVLNTSLNDSLTRTHMVIGTPDYMAPEQCEDTKTVDPRADVFALAVVAYEMITGGVPNARVIPPSRKIAVDPRIDGILLRALSREREKRYQTVREFRADLTGYERLPRNWWEKFVRKLTGR